MLFILWGKKNLEIITNLHYDQVNRKETNAYGIHGNGFNSVASELHQYRGKLHEECLNWWIMEMVINLKLLITLWITTYAVICFAFQEWCQNRQYLYARNVVCGKCLLGKWQVILSQPLKRLSFCFFRCTNTLVCILVIQKTVYILCHLC